MSPLPRLTERRLAHVLTEVKRPVNVREDEVYQEIGVRSHGRGLFHKEPITGEQLGDKQVFWLTPGHLVLNIVFAWERAVAVVSEAERGMIGSHRFPTFAVDSDKADVGFLMYLFHTEHGRFLLDINSPGAAGRNKTLDRGAWLKEKVVLPPAEWQRAATRYLDRKTADIDALIERKERLRGLMESRWASLLHQVATKGLDLSATLRPSGQEWVGLVPSHWPIAPIYSFCEVQLGKMLNPGAIGGEQPAPYLRNTNVQWDRVMLDDLNVMDFSPTDREKYALREGDLLVCEGGDVGRAAVWEGQMEGCYYQKALHRVRITDHSSLPRYLMYCLWAASIYGEFQAEGNQATIIHLTAEKLRVHRTPVPPVDEQHKIVAFLDTAREAANQAAETLAKQIELLSLHRQSLITAAVTGQLDLSSDPPLPAGVQP